MQEGVYARLVRIQMQVSKDPHVDRLLQSGESTPTQTATACNRNGNGAATAVLAKPQTTSARFPGRRRYQVQRQRFDYGNTGRR